MPSSLFSSSPFLSTLFLFLVCHAYSYSVVFYLVSYILSPLSLPLLSLLLIPFFLPLLCTFLCSCLIPYHLSFFRSHPPPLLFSWLSFFNLCHFFIHSLTYSLFFVSPLLAIPFLYSVFVIFILVFFSFLNLSSLFFLLFLKLLFLFFLLCRGLRNFVPPPLPLFVFSFSLLSSIHP